MTRSGGSGGVTTFDGRHDVHENGNEQGGDAEIWFINRGVVVLRPREPFVEWALALHGEAGLMTAAEIRSDATAYLIPDFEYSSEAYQWLEENHELFFALELAGWQEDTALWPADRGWSVFQEWFDVELIDTAWDLVDEPLTSDPPDDE
jgi:hypothetical protein